jgi:hypothetical protein
LEATEQAALRPSTYPVSKGAVRLLAGGALGVACIKNARYCNLGSIEPGPPGMTGPGPKSPGGMSPSTGGGMGMDGVMDGPIKMPPLTSSRSSVDSSCNWLRMHSSCLNERMTLGSRRYMARGANAL